MKANLVVAEMDPARIDVACRAVIHELIPFFQAQPGAGSAYWMVDSISGEVLALTTWDDEDALAAVRAAGSSHRARVGGRTGLVIRGVRNMDVIESHDVGLVPTAVARWARATWTGVGASERRVDPTAEPDATGDERLVPDPCGAYRLEDAATGTGLAVRFWDRPPAQGRVAPRRVAELHGLGVAAHARAR